MEDSPLTGLDAAPHPRAVTRILLVDDSRAVRLAAKRVLSDFPLEILEAQNGEEALDVLRKTPDLDAVLLDWNMPFMDGLTFLKAVRGDQQLPQPQIIMCTTENEFERILEALQVGADEYIMKPFTAEIIREKFEGLGIL